MNIALFYMRYRGSVICVNDGAWVHKGIIHSVVIAGTSVTVWIIDNNQRRGFVGYRTLEDFTDGKSAWLETVVQSWQVADAIISRAESQLNRAYDLLTFNCEHLVTLALGLEPESEQLQGYGWLALTCLAATIIVSNIGSKPKPKPKRSNWR
jgi:hypothetical protein